VSHCNNDQQGAIAVRAGEGFDMTASRGDTKPCTIADCLGTMQFGRRSDNYADTAAARRSTDRADPAMDHKGWVCSVDPNHFRRERQ
jgi:hypothetical protein